MKRVVSWLIHQVQRLLSFLWQAVHKFETLIRFLLLTEKAVNLSLLDQHVETQQNRGFVLAASIMFVGLFKSDGNPVIIINVDHGLAFDWSVVVATKKSAINITYNFLFYVLYCDQRANYC